MSDIVNHGVLNIDFEKFMDIVNNTTQEKTNLYQRTNDYYEGQAQKNNHVQAIEEQCETWYKDSAYSFWIKNDRLADLIGDDFYDKFDIKKEPIDINVYKFEPGQFTPPHQDTMGGSVKKLQTTPENVRKLWVALSPPEFGHAFFIGDQVFYNVPQGTIVEASFTNTWHSGVNAGFKDRYILAGFNKFRFR